MLYIDVRGLLTLPIRYFITIRACLISEQWKPPLDSYPCPRFHTLELWETREDTTSVYDDDIIRLDKWLIIVAEGIHQFLGQINCSFSWCPRFYTLQHNTRWSVWLSTCRSWVDRVLLLWLLRWSLTVEEGCPGVYYSLFLSFSSFSFSSFPFFSFSFCLSTNNWDVHQLFSSRMLRRLSACVRSLECTRSVFSGRPSGSIWERRALLVDSFYLTVSLDIKEKAVVWK